MRRYDVIAEICDAMLALGWKPYQNDHEDANGQFEMNWEYDDALVTADRHAFFKYMVKSIAEKHGLRATFMPKPFIGPHRQRLPRACVAVAGRREPVRRCRRASSGFRALAYHFLGGVMHSADALCALFNPTVNSYKRINAPPHALGRHLVAELGDLHRQQPHPHDPHSRAGPLRAAPGRRRGQSLSAAGRASWPPGSTGSPTSAIPGKRLDINMYTDGHTVKKAGKKLPLNLLDALRAFEGSEVWANGWAGWSPAYLKLKRQEWDAYARHLTAVGAREHAGLLIRMADTYDAIVIGGGVDRHRPPCSSSPRSAATARCFWSAARSRAGPPRIPPASSGRITACRSTWRWRAPASACSRRFAELLDEIPTADAGLVRSGYIIMAPPGPASPRVRASIADAAGARVEARAARPRRRRWSGIPGCTSTISTRSASRRRPGSPILTWPPPASPARRAARGASIRTNTPVTGLIRDGDRVIGVQTAGGPIHAGVVLSAVNVWSQTSRGWAGIEIPMEITAHHVFTLAADRPYSAGPAGAEGSCLAGEALHARQRRPPAGRRRA